MTDAPSDNRPLRVVAGKDRAATLRALIAKSGVPLGGFELNPRSEQTQPNNVVTARELAAMDFTPWEMDHPPGQPGPSAKLMQRLGISARTAAALVERSKSELISAWRDTPNDEADALFEMMDDLQEAAEIMKSVAAMVQTAHLRLLIAVHAYSAEIGGAVWAEVEGNTTEEVVCTVSGQTVQS
jgi:hypothetical protein